MKNFKCNRCGDCCHSPRLYKVDIERIKKSGVTNFIYTDNLGNTYVKDKDGWCMFLEKGKNAKCSVYDKRPKICRLYPSRLRSGSCKPEKLSFDDYLEKKNG